MEQHSSLFSAPIMGGARAVVILGGNLKVVVPKIQGLSRWGLFPSL